MEIGVLGTVFIVVFVFNILLKKEWSLFILLLSSFFPSLSIFIIGSLNISVGQFLIVLLSFMLIIKCMISKTHIYIGNRYLGLFILYIIVAFLINLFLVNPELMLISQSGKITPVKDSKLVDSYKHICLIIICYISYIYSYNYSLKNTIKLDIYFKIISLIIIFLNILQFLCWKFEWPYNFIFRNNSNAINQSTFFLGAKIIRLAPTSLEPSMNSIILLFLIGYFIFRNKILKEKIIVFNLIVLGMITKSTSFYLGILILIINYFILIFKNKKKVNIFLGFILNLFILFVFKDYILNLVFEISTKISGQDVSGSIRLRNFSSNMIVFKNNIFLGVGFGRTRSEDLLSTWLASLGLVGFALIILSIKFSLNKSLKKNKIEYKTLIVIFLVMLVSVPEPYYLYIWITWGILDGINKKNKIRKIVL